jgi:hypothetical protein
MMPMIDVSEHEKMAKIKDNAQVIGEFLEWLNDKGITLCRLGDPYGQFFPDGVHIEDRLAEYYGIDLNKIEKEKRAMLEDMRQKVI